MDNKTILSKISDIENGAFNLRRIKDVAKTTRTMSKVSDITTLQIFLNGLAEELEAIGFNAMHTWNEMYMFEKALEAEQEQPEPTIDEEAEVTENDLPFC